MGRGDSTVAIMLAVGRGERLGDLTSEVPKCLLQIGTEAGVAWRSLASRATRPPGQNLKV
jgi:NDP-sugar pyrophosphorylase family protein